MHFQHPELLYALILLIIPLIVHLFRLRKFQKEDFTNVKFLKKVIQETRKSSRLKRFLILITRLLIVACLVLAFAQPFLPASGKALSDSKTLIFLDNSFSMQASDNQSSVFRKSVNQLLENLKEEREYSLFTNNSDYFGSSTNKLKSDLQEIGYSNASSNFRDLKLKAENFFKNHPGSEKDFVIISDFQSNLNIPTDLESDNINYHLIVTQPKEVSNINLDTAYIADSNPENLSLRLNVRKNSESEEPVTISVFDGEKLLGRNTIQTFENEAAEINFRLQNEKISNGRIEIGDNGLDYDNRLFFNIGENRKIQVVIISNKDPEFLQRIYADPEFETSVFSPSQINFNKLNAANLIVLNEIEQFPNSLINNISNTKNNGASIILIPSMQAKNDRQILNVLGFPYFGEKLGSERLITNILFDHPLLDGVFENRIDNFEYPKVLSSFNFSSTNAILTYQDNQPFLVESNNSYLFTAALNKENSNFTNSPLIVPVFYQIGLNSLKTNQLYYQTNKEHQIDIPVELSKDQVLHIANPENDLIPQQQNFSNRVEINTNNIILDAGNYSIKNNSSEIGNISFNYDRAESELTYSKISENSRFNIYESVEEYFSKSNAASQITVLWKWFVIFALIFLAIEMLLIKFLK